MWPLLSLGGSLLGMNLWNVEFMDEFCYLGDKINAGGGAEAGLVARVRSGWKKFGELLPLLTLKGFSFHAKSCCTQTVRSAMLY